MFTAHDAGHRGITQNFVKDTLIGVFIADFCCGLSIGWWKSSHNVHHLITNSAVSYSPSMTCQAQDTNNHIGARSRHSERTTLRHLPFLLQIDTLKLLQFHLRLGQGSRHRCPLPEIHILSRHGRGPLQSLSPLNTPSHPRSQTLALRPLDSKSRNCKYSMLLVPVWLLSCLAHPTRLADTNRIRPYLAHRHHATARSDHIVALGYANSGSWRG